MKFPGNKQALFWFFSQQHYYATIQSQAEIFRSFAPAPATATTSVSASANANDKTPLCLLLVASLLSLLAREGRPCFWVINKTCICFASKNRTFSCCCCVDARQYKVDCKKVVVAVMEITKEDTIITLWLHIWISGKRPGMTLFHLLAECTTSLPVYLGGFVSLAGIAKTSQPLAFVVQLSSLSKPLSPW